MENCPVPDVLLKQLLDATLNAVSDIGEQLPETERAALAIYCYRRAHFRNLGLSLAAMCSRTALVQEAGHAGELLHRQALDGAKPASFGADTRSRFGKAPVSLHVI
ncbi:hypothetical protein FMN50_04990 [Rhodobacterales bacterium]|nr:hypothetical protein FMN50_04990 [Rhodobacterales bacterium]